ncbi:hypothetical protein HAZT_HAZT006214, partial [Hyalella azteca]
LSRVLFIYSPTLTHLIHLFTHSHPFIHLFTHPHTGLSQALSIALVGSVCTLYSALGGMKAVLITDVLQSVLMFAAVLIVVCTGLQTFSLSQVFSIANQSGRLQFFSLDPDPRTRHTLWTQVLGGSVTYLSLYAVNQAQVQRLLACRSVPGAGAAPARL